MRYITSWEQFAREEGLERGLRLAMTTILESRFGTLPDALNDTIEALDEEKLQEALPFVSVVKTIDELRHYLTSL